MNRFRTTLTFLALTLLAGACLAHETRILGPEDGTQYAVTVGMLDEPVFTELRTGLDLIVRVADTEDPVEGLEASLRVTITAPTGETRMLDVRPQFRAPGHYTDHYVLTIPGTYLIRITGFIGELEIDETYPREVGDVTDIRFP